MELTQKDISLLLFLLRVKLNNERKRPSKVVNGVDIQAQKVREMSDLYDRLEEMRLAQ